VSGTGYADVEVNQGRGKTVSYLQRRAWDLADSQIGSATPCEEVAALEGPAVFFHSWSAGEL
jgi:hypothetical protein